MIKNHALDIVSSMVDAKTAAAAVVTTGATVTAVTVEATNQITLNDISVSAAIFAASATGVVMLLNAVLKVLEIKRMIKKRDHDRDKKPE